MPVPVDNARNAQPFVDQGAEPRTPPQHPQRALDLACYIPAYNESRLIGSVLEPLARNLAAQVTNFELVVVDDHSSDGSADRVQALGLPGVRVVRHERGPSFRENLARSMIQGSAQILMFVDADMGPSEATLGAFLTELHAGADLVVGNRYHPDLSVQRRLGRRVISHAYNGFLRTAFSSRIQDHQCGLKAFRADVLRGLVAQMAPDPDFQRGWFWDAELLVRAQWAGLRIAEVPVAPDTRRDSRAMLATQYAILPWVLRLLAARP